MADNQDKTKLGAVCDVLMALFAELKTVPSLRFPESCELSATAP